MSVSVTLVSSVTDGHCWATTLVAVVSSDVVGSCRPPSAAGTAGSAASAVLSTVPAASSELSSIGRAGPPRNRFWPSVEYRNSSHSRAAAGSGADLVIAW